MKALLFIIILVSAQAFAGVELPSLVVLGNSSTSSLNVTGGTSTAVLKVTGLTASTALTSNASKDLTSSAVTSTELGVLAGVSTGVVIQTQLNTKITNPMNSGGDLITGGASGVPTRVANGSAGQVLTSAGTTLPPTWTTVSGSAPTTGFVETPLGTGNVKLLVTEFGGASSGDVCNSDPCTKRNNHGTAFGTINKLGSGVYDANFTTALSAAPVCTCVANDGGTMLNCAVAETSITDANEIRLRNSGGTLTDGEVNLICVGPE